VEQRDCRRSRLIPKRMKSRGRRIADVRAGQGPAPGAAYQSCFENCASSEGGAQALACAVRLLFERNVGHEARTAVAQSLRCRNQLIGSFGQLTDSAFPTGGSHIRPASKQQACMGKFAIATNSFHLSKPACDSSAMRAFRL
jgi:hypothetical protein